MKLTYTICMKFHTNTSVLNYVLEWIFIVISYKQYLVIIKISCEYHHCKKWWFVLHPWQGSCRYTHATKGVRVTLSGGYRTPFVFWGVLLHLQWKYHLLGCICIPQGCTHNPYMYLKLSTIIYMDVPYMGKILGEKNGK